MRFGYWALHGALQEAQDLRSKLRGSGVMRVMQGGDAGLMRMELEYMLRTGESEMDHQRMRVKQVARNAEEYERDRLFNVYVTLSAADPFGARIIEQQARARIDPARTAEEARQVYDSAVSDRSELGPYVAGLLAAKALEEGWTDIVADWMETPHAKRQGGYEALERLQWTARVAAWTEVPECVQPLGTVEEFWPEAAAHFERAANPAPAPARRRI